DFHYDAGGKLEQTVSTDARSGVTAYYDRDGKLQYTEATVDGKLTRDYFDQDGRLSRRRTLDANGTQTTTDFHYDFAGLLRQTVTARPDGTVITDEYDDGKVARRLSVDSQGHRTFSTILYY